MQLVLLFLIQLEVKSKPIVLHPCLFLHASPKLVIVSVIIALSFEGFICNISPKVYFNKVILKGGRNFFKSNIAKCVDHNVKLEVMNKAKNLKPKEF